jgi:hypothetical protein
MRSVKNFARFAANGSIPRLAIISLLAIILLYPSIAHAFLGDLIVFGASIFLGAINLLLGRIIGWELQIISFLVSPGEALPLTRDQFVIMGWRFMRDMVNLGLVIGIAIIAIGFILRLQTYGSQKTLIRLIAVAILVNFSLPIAGIFTDTAALLSGVFIREIGNIENAVLAASGLNNIKNVLINPAEVQRRFAIEHGNEQQEMRQRGFVDVLRLVFLILFAIILIAVLGIMIIMLIIRLVRLWFLLILAPLAWFSWIFPVTESYWKRWWHEFLNWTFFAPILLFFLAFATRLAYHFPDGGLFWQMIMQFTVGVVAIILALTLAQQSGITLANVAVQTASNIAKWPGRTAWRAGVSGSKDRFSRSGIGKGFEKYTAKSRFFGGAADQIKKWRDESDAKIDKQKQRMIDAKLSVQEIEKFSRTIGITPVQRYGAIMAAAANKDFAKLDEKEQKRILAIAQSHSRKSAMEVLAANPLLADHWDNTYGKTEGMVGGIEGVVRRLRADDIEKLANNAAALGDTRVIKALLGRKDHLERLAEKVSEDNMAILQKTFKTLREALVNQAPGYDQVVHDEFDKLARINYFNQAFKLNGPTRKSRRRFQIAGQTGAQGSKPQGPTIIVPTDISSTRRESVSGEKLPRQEPPTTEPPASEPPKA